MTFPRLVLYFFGLMFMALGALFLADPLTVNPMIRIGSPARLVVTDLRAVYGGMEFGIGMFLAICAASGRATVPGLWALVCVFWGLALGRVVGSWVDQSGGLYTFGLIVAEIGGGLVGFAAILVERRRNGPEPVDSPTPSSDSGTPG